MTRTLQNYLADWDRKQKEAHDGLDLFNTNKIKTLSAAQRQHFVKVFYHLRGHFHDFLWFMGNHAPNEKSKQVILDNISEELGQDKNSHEQLYWRFARELGADLRDEVVNGTTYLPFAREFNRRHLEWLSERGWPSKVGAYSAYERLDNLDYSDLMKLAQALDLSHDALTFFKVHTLVKHYEQAEEGFSLPALWTTNEADIIEAYEFIGDHQIQMWQDLGREVFGDKT